MSYERYSQLLDGICERFKLTASKTVYDNFEFEIEEKHFRLVHGGDEDSDGLYLFGDFGSLYDIQQNLMMEWLLTNNLFSYGDATQFALQPENDHILLIIRLSLSKTDLDRLFNLISHVLINMHGWETSFYVYAIPQLEASTMYSEDENSQNISANIRELDFKQEIENDADEKPDTSLIKFLSPDEGALSAFVQSQMRDLVAQDNIPDLPLELDIAAAELESRNVIRRAANAEK